MTNSTKRLEIEQDKNELLAVYLLLQSREREIDCVCVRGWMLLDYLGLKLMRRDRLKRLVQGMSATFPCVTCVFKHNGTAFGSMYVSRKRIPMEVMCRSLKDPMRVDILNWYELRTEIVPIPTEDEIYEILIRWEQRNQSHRLKDAQSIPAIPALTSPVRISNCVNVRS